MTGVVAAIGSKVTKFRVGDTCGVGCMLQSCGECESCQADLEQHCLNGDKLRFTYNSPDDDLGGHTYGGWAEQIVVNEKFVLRVPPAVNQAAFAPLLCAGVTTFSPLRRWNIERGRRVGVVGLGGLGHIAVKLAASRGADITVFTTTPAKIGDAYGSRITKIAVTVNGRQPALVVDVPGGARRKTIVRFPQPQVVRKLEVKVLAKEECANPEKAVGFAEVELQTGREGPAAR